jgi:hypothetical protein
MVHCALFLIFPATLNGLLRSRDEVTCITPGRLPAVATLLVYNLLLSLMDEGMNHGKH